MEKYLTVSEIAAKAGAHEETVRRWIRSDIFEGVKKGDKNMSLVPESSVENFLNSGTAHHHSFIEKVRAMNVVSSNIWPLNLGQIYTFGELKAITDCPTIRGIRYRTGSPNLSIITSLSEAQATSQHNPYEDRFENGVLMYTGEGQKGDQKLSSGNLRLYEAITTHQPVHVFQKLQVDQYLFCGLFRVIGYQTERQPGSDDFIRTVFIFKLTPIVNPNVSPSNKGFSDVVKETNEEQKLLDSLLQIQSHLKNEKISAESLPTRYKRSHKLVDTLKKLYDYKCQLCDPQQPSPEIVMKDGKKYVEVHHVLGFSEILSGMNDEQNEEYVIDQYNNVICCCAHHHRLLHHYRSPIVFNKEKLTFKSEDGSLTLPIHLRHDWHTFE